MEFWENERTELEGRLLLRRFEQDFKKIKISFDEHVNELSEIPELVENLEETEKILESTVVYEDSLKYEFRRVNSLQKLGQDIIELSPENMSNIEPKCLELSGLSSHVQFLLHEKYQKQEEWKKIQLRVEKANTFCADAIGILNAQQFSSCSTSIADESSSVTAQHKQIKSLILQCDLQLHSLSTLKKTLKVTAEATPLVKQIQKRLEDVQNMLHKRDSALTSLKNLGGTRSFSNGLSKNLLIVSEQDNQTDDDTFDGVSNIFYSELSLPLSQGKLNGRCSNNELGQLKRQNIIEEILQTEQTYVNELGLILTGYRDQASNPELQPLLPSQLSSRQDRSKPGPNVGVLFCNLEEIYNFHFLVFLPDLIDSSPSIERLATCFIDKNPVLLDMYSEYCRLKSASEALLREIGENHPWLVVCQQKLGHRLSLSSYLLTPIQRITKYHLLLGNLMKESGGVEGEGKLMQALDSMLILVRKLNDGLHQLQIRGYPFGPLSGEGNLLLQGPFTIWTATVKNRFRLRGHQRYLFLYPKSLLICKRTGVQSSLAYEFKKKIDMKEVGLTEDPKGTSSKKFEIWVDGRDKVFLIQAPNREVKKLWVTQIKKVLLDQLETLRLSNGSPGNGMSPLTSSSVPSRWTSRSLPKMNGFFKTGSPVMARWIHSSIDEGDGGSVNSRFSTSKEDEDDAWSSGVSEGEDDELKGKHWRRAGSVSSMISLDESSSSNSNSARILVRVNSTAGVGPSSTSTQLVGQYSEHRKQLLN